MADQFGAKSTADEVLAGVDLKGKRFLVTGASAGLGIETSRALVARGADVVGAVRDLAKGERATAEVRKAAEASGGSFSLIELDLADLASARAASDKLNAKGDTFDVVIANAGVMATPFGKTKDGFETQFGTNHLGHFVFVNRIAGLIKDGGRLVNLSSAGHRFSDVNLDDINFEKTEYVPFVAYGRSKTANIQFSVGFDARHKARGVRATAVHPGGIQTELGRHMSQQDFDGMLENLQKQRELKGLPPFEFKSIPQGSATSVWAAVVAPADAVGANYCEDCHVAKLVQPNEDLMSGGVYSYALDPAKAEALWKKSEELVGETF